MAKTDSSVRVCAIADALEVIGERWSLLVVRELVFDNRRFAGIAARTGAPSDVLSARLKTLSAHGVIERRPYSEHPPRSEYYLTDKGRALAPVLLSLQEWGIDNLPKGNREPDLVSHGDHSLRPVVQVRCAVCGEVAVPERHGHGAEAGR